MPAFVSRYATAFLEVVTAAHLDTAAIDQQLADFLSTWDGSAELRAFFENPAVPAAQKVTFLDTLNKELQLLKELRNLLAVLIQNGRIAHVKEVVKSYRQLLQQQLGIHLAEIVTARELSPNERQTMIDGVATLAAGRIEPSFKIDKSILGGAVVRIGSTVYDGSVRGRLERLKEQLVAG
ncbi:MAG: ATP synthase F1 subunit delta [Terracidiphilus sp.]